MVARIRSACLWFNEAWVELKYPVSAQSMDADFLELIRIAGGNADTADYVSPAAVSSIQVAMCRRP